MLHSQSAVARKIWNGCGRTEEDNLTALIENVLEPARERYGKPIHVSSGYRCPQLNSLIHGATQSQHLRGEAADICTDAGPEGNLQLARIIVALGTFDQLILENVPGNQLLPQWLHVSYRRSGGNRHEIRKKVAGGVGYPTLTAYELGSIDGRRAILW